MSPPASPNSEVRRPALRWWRWLQVLLALLVVGLAVRALALHWGAFRTQAVEWRLSARWLAASVVIVLAIYVVLIEAWRRVVVGMNQSLGFPAAARIWVLSSLGKYLPGKLWAIAGAAMLAKQAGVDPLAAVSGALALQALALGSGFVIVAGAAPRAFDRVGQGVVVAMTTLGLAALAGLITLSWPAAFGRMRRLLPASVRTLRPIPVRQMALGFVANCVAWVGYGTAFFCLGRGVLPDPSLSLGQAITVFTASYLVGLITLFAPGGLGPRESVFVLLLLEPLGAKPAVALAVASRLLLTLTELGSAVPFLLPGSRSPGTRGR